jgi:hypothetical protein
MWKSILNWKDLAADKGEFRGENECGTRNYFHSQHVDNLS